MDCSSHAHMLGSFSGLCSVTLSGTYPKKDRLRTRRMARASNDDEARGLLDRGSETPALKCVGLGLYMCKRTCSSRCHCDGRGTCAPQCEKMANPIAKPTRQNRINSWRVQGRFSSLLLPSVTLHSSSTSRPKTLTRHEAHYPSPPHGPRFQRRRLPSRAPTGQRVQVP